MCLIIRQLPSQISEIETIRRMAFIFLLFFIFYKMENISSRKQAGETRTVYGVLMKRNLKFECLFPSSRSPGRKSSASFYQKPEHYLTSYDIYDRTKIFQNSEKRIRRSILASTVWLQKTAWRPSKCKQLKGPWKTSWRPLKTY